MDTASIRRLQALVFGLSPGAVTWRSEQLPAMEENVLIGFEHLDARLHALFAALQHQKQVLIPVPLEFARPGEPKRTEEKRIITDPAELAAKFAGLT